MGVSMFFSIESPTFPLWRVWSIGLLLIVLGVQWSMILCNHGAWVYLFSSILWKGARYSGGWNGCGRWMWIWELGFLWGMGVSVNRWGTCCEEGWDSRFWQIFLVVLFLFSLVRRGWLVFNLFNAGVFVDLLDVGSWWSLKCWCKEQFGLCLETLEWERCEVRTSLL